MAGRGPEAAADPIVRAIDRVEEAAVALHAAVDPVVAALVEARSQRASGTPLVSVVAGLVERGGRELRLTPFRACRDLERAVTAYRATAVRELVDHDGLTFTEIAALTGVSRQMVSRLYREAAPA